MSQERILVTGARGQIGTALLPALKAVYGDEAIVASDLREPEGINGVFEQLDVSDAAALTEIIQKYRISQIYHLAAVLSVKGEGDPLSTWDTNIKTLLNVLEAARIHKISKVFVPSTIAVFGPSATKFRAGQNVFLDPATVYGISKVAAENWCLYYHRRYGLDVRSIRYPGVISYQSRPDGGTTDYAVDIFHKALVGDEYTCFLKEDTILPMIYMDDVISATLKLMAAPPEKIRIRTSYNLASISFSPADLHEALVSHFPDFRIRYQPDSRQFIADTWPASIDDSQARKDWGWKPEFNLEVMVSEMVKNLSVKYHARSLQH